MLLPTPYFNPTLLRCSHFNGYAAPLEPYTSRTVYEYELEYFLRSEGGIVVDGNFLSFSAGDISIRKPGQVVQGIPPYEGYILLVDVVGNESRANQLAFGSPEEAQERYENPLLDSLPNKLSPNKKDLIAGLFETILQNQNSSGDLHFFQVRSNLYFLFSEMFQEAADQNLTGNTGAIRGAIRYIHQHFLEPLPINQLIAESGLSPSCFHRRFLEETGMTPRQLVAALRVEQAKNLLSFTHTPIGEIGSLCGYQDHVYFSRVFHQFTGMSPSAYRRLTKK